MLTKKRILIGREWYNYENCEELGLEKILFQRARKIHTLSWFRELLMGDMGILSWKGAARTKPYYENMGEAHWRELFRLAIAAKEDPRSAVKKIVRFSQKNMWHKPNSGSRRNGGIGFPVASTIVFFMNGGNCPVIDWRAVFALIEESCREQLQDVGLNPRRGGGGYQLSTDEAGWEEYFGLCHEIVRKLDIPPLGEDTPLRVLDKALWMNVPSRYEGRSKEIRSGERPPSAQALSPLDKRSDPPRGCR